MIQEGYPVNSLSRRLKANEGKYIFLKCIITYVIHHWAAVASERVV